MRIASWNINGIRARTPNLLSWLIEREPDVIALQELRSSDGEPMKLLEDLGYHVAHTDHTALVSVHPLTDVDLPTGDGRTVAATSDGMRVVSVYAPNGRKAGTDRHRAKLDWLNSFVAVATLQTQRYERVSIVGDFNVAREPLDVWKPDKYRGRNLFTSEERSCLDQLIERAALHDCHREAHTGSGLFTWWNYAHDSFERGRGWRLDYMFCNDAVANSVQHAVVDIAERARPRTSDHAPLWLDLAPAEKASDSSER